MVKTQLTLICCLALFHKSLGYDIDFVIDKDHANYTTLDDDLKKANLDFKTEKLEDGDKIYRQPNNGYYIEKNERNITIKKDGKTAIHIIRCTVFDFGQLDGNRNTKHNATCLTNDMEYNLVTINATIRQPATSVVTGGYSGLEIAGIVAAVWFGILLTVLATVWQRHFCILLLQRFNKGE